EENEQVREYDAQDDGSDSEVHVNLQQDLKAAQLEARYVTRQLLAMKQSGALVYDAKQERYRPIEWRDTVILLRSISAMAPVFLDELQLAGIPAYSSIGTGYFEAVEVQTMLSVLQIIDNPY